MGLVARRELQHGGLDLDEIPRREQPAQRRRDARRAPAGTAAGRHGRGCPEGRAIGHQTGSLARPRRCAKSLANARAGSVWCARQLAVPSGMAAPPSGNRGRPTVKVIASSLRKGNIVELDGKLYVVLNAESFHPGKGTPTTQVDMRRISDGVKIGAALQDHRAGRARLCRGPRAPVPLSGRRRLSLHEYRELRAGHIAGRHRRRPGRLPAAGDEGHARRPRGRAGLDRAAAEGGLGGGGNRAVGQGPDRASSYKPAVLSNGVRTMVPPFVGPGTKIVVMTADGTYVERAKDLTRITPCDADQGSFPRHLRHCGS